MFHSCISPPRWLPAAVLFVCATSAHASLLTSHFGVTLSVLQVTTYDATLGGNYTRYAFNNDWTPTPETAEYVVADWNQYWSTTDASVNGPGIAGGEPYDVEALYFDNDTEYIYIAAVTSFPGAPGRRDSRVSDALVVSGDLALDFGINGAASAADGFNYDYGINLNNERRQSSGDALAGLVPAVGSGLYRTLNSDWYTGTTRYAEGTARNELTNFDPAYSTFGGALKGAADVQYELVDFGGALENGAETYVISAKIPLSNLPNLRNGDKVGVQWVMGCRNDGSTTTNVIRAEGEANIPEPSTAAVFLLGLGTLALRRRRPA